jgi:adenine-specific DNA-methyltransferase
MSGKQKLELTWVGKENRPRLEPRVLLEEPARSYHAVGSKPNEKRPDNRLIFGDNLLALKALEQEFAGRVKCIYVDPPYNTGSAFEHFDDGLEHSIWLSLMRDRFEILSRLLHPEGSLWVSIDDNEAAYLRVMLDEIFGRQNFVSTVIWEKRTSRENRRVFSFNHDYILVFARDRARFEQTRNLLPLSDEVRGRYKNPDNDPRGPWQSISANAMAGHGTPSQFYKLKTPTGVLLDPPAGRCWLYTQQRMEEEIAKGNIWFGKNGKSVPRIKRFLSDTEGKGLTPETIWRADEVGTNDSAKKDLIALFDGRAVFDNPKPEGLIKRIVEIGTNAGDVVLDSFAGSGTTGAVAHKMHRRWIMVELGKHCYDVIIPRLQKVIDGTDQGGVSEAVEWKGGGGFNFYRLAESLLVTDKDLSTPRKPVYIINPKYDPKMLVRAICKIENFRYLRDNHWHGISSEHHFLYVTTNLLSQRHLDTLSAQLGEEEALLVYCTRRASGLKVPDNIEVRKIPRDLLAKCTFDEERV